ncbi:MAG: MoxR family ATPase [Deltaproteobacteria bacterium]|nr:MoxR family ATPase [Deltaproteobacteria bacterium]
MSLTDELIRAKVRVVDGIRSEIARVVVGQEVLVERLLVGLLAGGHVLIEGVPGLAKTSAVKALASTIRAEFKRVQFTPDLLPADLTGTEIFQPRTGDFAVRKGPIFHNLVLADEINRAPSKVQSALLEAMQERQVTIGDQTYGLAEPFLVLATQNPIEHEGTYPLPEAQADRFMLKLLVGYPTREEEKEIVRRFGNASVPEARPVAGKEDLAEIRGLVQAVYVDELLLDYIVDVVTATRDPVRYGLGLAAYIRLGASPRASLYLAAAARVHAFLRGRNYVVPGDVKALAPDVLRHRILLTYEAEAEGVTTDDLIRGVLDGVAVP